MNFRFLLLLNSLSLLIFSCNYNGNTNPKSRGGIQVDKDYVCFPLDGGEEVVTCLNHEKWWIVDFTDLIIVDGEWQIENSFSKDLLLDPEKWKFEYADDWLQLDGCWYSVSVPQTSGCAKLLISVAPNETGISRKLFVEMECGNWFKTITIEQQ